MTLSWSSLKVLLYLRFYCDRSIILVLCCAVRILYFSILRDIALVLYIPTYCPALKKLTLIYSLDTL